VQDDRKLARNCDTGFGHAVPLGNTHTPRLQGRPFLALGVQRQFWRPVGVNYDDRNRLNR
jgi:hypothetical protein